MKKNIQKTIAVLGAAVLATGMVGCGSSNTNTSAADTSADSSAAESGAAADTTENSADTKDLSGSITLAGSTSMEKFANALAETFMEKYPNVTVQAEFTGSSAGIESVLAGQCDVGDSSRALKDDEKAKGAVENIVAIDGIAVVVDPSNAVDGLSKDDLTGIYDGSITNWKDVGGSDMPIVVVGREAGSGTRGAFEELLGLEDACKYANELDSTGAVMAKVASTPGSIGYVSLDVVDDTVKAVKLDDVEPTEENIKAYHAEFSEEYNKRCVSRTRPYEGIGEVIEALRAEGKLTAVASNKPDKFVKYIVGEIFKNGEFDMVAGKKDGVPTKPAPDIIYNILETLGVKAQEAVIIGDSDVDVMTAKNSGLQCIGCQWGFRGREELERAGADFIAAKPADILKANI